MYAATRSWAPAFRLHFRVKYVDLLWSNSNETPFD